MFVMQVSDMELKSRTQAERRATTRRLLLDATIEMLMDSGLSSCSLAAVAKRASMTTGAVQHHFNTKAELIRAVIAERLFAADEPFDWDGIVDLSIAKRCERMIAYQWKFYENPKYLAIWDIILGARTEDLIQNEIREWQRSGTRSFEHAIVKAFPDKHLKQADVSAFQYFLNGHLRGLALLRTVENDPKIIKRQLTMLGVLLTKYIDSR